MGGVDRLNGFNLKLAEDKTRSIAFGRHAEDESREKGVGKPETLDFLGFTHYCGKSGRGWFRVKSHI